MKRALLGVANNLKNNIQKVTLWSKSFKEVCPNDEVIL